MKSFVWRSTLECLSTPYSSVFHLVLYDSLEHIKGFHTRSFLFHYLIMTFDFWGEDKSDSLKLENHYCWYKRFYFLILLNPTILIPFNWQHLEEVYFLSYSLDNIVNFLLLKTNITNTALVLIPIYPTMSINYINGIFLRAKSVDQGCLSIATGMEKAYKQMKNMKDQGAPAICFTKKTVVKVTQHKYLLEYYDLD